MAEEDGLIADLAGMLVAALGYNTTDPAYYAGRLATRLGIGEDDSAETVAEVLRKALGLPAGTCELVSARHGTHCTHPAVVRLVGACGHGHVAERRVCGKHRTPEEPLWCRTCYRLDGPDAHKCPVAMLGAGSAEAAQAAGTE